jgi:4-hydroxy-tetrahydrodipicolinate synthase
MFIETNPVPVKAAMSMMGLMNEEYRLPLSPLGKANKEILKNTLESVNIL